MNWTTIILSSLLIGIIVGVMLGLLYNYIKLFFISKKLNKYKKTINDEKENTNN